VGYTQINSIPTPLLTWSTAGGILFLDQERAGGSLACVSLTSPAPDPVSITESGGGSLACVSLTSPAPDPVSITESGGGTLQCVSLVAPVQINLSPTADSAGGTLATVSLTSP
jgi:hypothetical protein